MLRQTDERGKLEGFHSIGVNNKWLVISRWDATPIGAPAWYCVSRQKLAHVI